MSKNVYQFIDVGRIEPPKKDIEKRKIDLLKFINLSVMIKVLAKRIVV